MKATVLFQNVCMEGLETVKYKRDDEYGKWKTKNKVVNCLFKGWTKHRADLNFSQKTFNEMWKENKGRKDA